MSRIVYPNLSSPNTTTNNLSLGTATTTTTTTYDGVILPGCLKTRTIPTDLAGRDK